MKRRDFLGGLSSGAALAACSPQTQEENEDRRTTQRFSWKIVTTWLPNFPGLGTGVNTLVRYIHELSGGRMDITIYGAGELVPATEVFDTVSEGNAEMGHEGYVCDTCDKEIPKGSSPVSHLEFARKANSAGVGSVTGTCAWTAVDSRS